MRRILTKISLALASLLIGLSPLLNSVPVSASGIYEYRGVAPEGDGNLYDEGAYNQNLAQLFVAQGNHTVTSVSVFMKREGVNPGMGSISADITPINGTDFTPLGAPIVSSTGSLSGSSVSNTTGAWYSITMDGSEIVDGTTYALVLTPSGIDIAKCIGWYVGNADGAGLSAHSASSTNGGGWVGDAVNYYSFRIYGEDYTPPTVPTVVTEAATAITGVGATLHGNLTDMGSYTATGVRTEFFYGTTTAYGYYEIAEANQTAIGNFSAVVSDMPGNTTIHYKAVATGLGGGLQASGADMTFNTTAAPTPSPTPTSTPPTVTTGTVHHEGADSVTLYGNLDSLGTADNCTIGFLFGTGIPEEWYYDAYGSPKNSTGLFAVTLTGLVPGTTYYYAARAEGDGVDFGDDLSFTHYATTPPAIPTVTTESAVVTNLAPQYYQVVLNGNITSLAGHAEIGAGFRFKKVGTSLWEPFTYELHYNATGSYNQTILISAPQDTNYVYQAFVWDGIGQPAFLPDSSFGYGDALIFITNPTFTPVVFNVILNPAPATSIGKTSAIVSATVANQPTNSTVNVLFSYGVGDYNSPMRVTLWGDMIPITNNGTATYTIPNLTPSTDYWFHASGSIGLSLQQSSPAYLTFRTLNFDGSTPTPTGTPGPTITPTPTPTSTPSPHWWDVPPIDISTVGWHYIELIITLLAIPLFSIYIAGRKVGTPLGMVIDIVVLAAGIAVGWIGIWEILLLALTAGVVVAYFVRKALGMA